MQGSQAYTLRKTTGRTPIWSSYRPQHGGNFRSLVENDETEFKIFYFWTYKKLVKLRDSQLETVEMEKKKNQVVARNDEGAKGCQLSRTDAKEQQSCRVGDVTSVIWVKGKVIPNTGSVWPRGWVEV